MDKLYDIYRSIFCRKTFFNLNYALYHLSLRGMGIANPVSESGEKLFIHNVVAKMDEPVVLDIGANVGRYAVAVRSANPEAELYAFEPHPKTFKTLEDQAEQYCFNAIQSACGSEEGTITLYDYDEEGSSHASAMQEVIEEIHEKEKISTDVPVTTVDGFADTHDLSCIDLLKIDTEGYEEEVLKGARSMINSSSVRFVQLEFNEMNIKSRTFARDIIDILDGYKIFRMLPDGLVHLGEYHPLKYEIFGFQNLIAINSSDEKLEHYL
jgi:FkbM family methyltransferase